MTMVFRDRLDILNDTVFLNFIDAGDKRPSKPAEVSRVSMIKHYKYGLRDLEYNPQLNIVIWLAADAGALNHIAKFFSFGKSKDQEAVSEGIIEGYEVIPDSS